MYVPVDSPDIEPVVPVPVVVNPPGLTVIVQVPDEGKPLKSTVPVEIKQVGCVIVPTIGAVGVVGAVFITAFVEAPEVHPEAFVTVKVYVVPAVKPVKLPVVPEPVIVVPPGLAVTVQEPEEGKPLNATLAVATEQVGCVIVPITGAVGGVGAALIMAFVEAEEVHVKEFVTVKV